MLTCLLLQGRGQLPLRDVLGREHVWPGGVHDRAPVGVRVGLSSYGTRRRYQSGLKSSWRKCASIRLPAPVLLPDSIRLQSLNPVSQAVSPSRFCFSRCSSFLVHNVTCRLLFPARWSVPLVSSVGEGCQQRGWPATTPHGLRGGAAEVSRRMLPSSQ